MSFQEIGPTVGLVLSHAAAFGVGIFAAARWLSKRSSAVDWKSLASNNPRVGDFLLRLSAEDDMLARSIKRVADYVSDPGDKATRTGNVVDEFDSRHRVLMDCYLPLPVKDSVGRGGIFGPPSADTKPKEEGEPKGTVTI